jgi:hypothetical protein
MGGLEIFGERKIAFEELMSEEQRIKGLVSELRLTLAEGNNPKTFFVFPLFKSFQALARIRVTPDLRSC